MSDKTSMSLDEIIQSNKRRSSKRGTGKNRGSAQKIVRPKQSGFGVGRGHAGIKRKVNLDNISIGESTGKLIISNLDFGVSDSDIIQLFAEAGPLKSAAVHHDVYGRSLGTADVTFERRNDAIRALKQYNRVPLDGRTMNIELTMPEVALNMKIRVIEEKKIHNRSPRRGRSKNLRGRGGKNRKSQRKQPRVTAEELDAELDAYTEKMKMDITDNSS